MAQKRLTPESMGEKRSHPLPPPPDEPILVDFDALPFAKLMRIERLAGVRMSEWEGGVSDAQKLVAVVSVLYDADFDLVAEADARTLARYVDMSGPADGEDDDPGNG